MKSLLDACALIAYLNEEQDGCEAVDGLFSRAKAGELALCMNIVNLTEVYYGYIRDKGITEADRIMRPVSFFPIQIINTITEAVYHETARIKRMYRPLSFADAFLCGTAKSMGATIVTKDSEIRKLEKPESLSVIWIKP